MIPAIFREENEISIFNNGRGIPVVLHKIEKLYVPELIFGTLLTSSNYDDSERKVTGFFLIFLAISFYSNINWK